jgi:glycosyltransferase involved in cell wall biosynthesis
MTDAPAGTPPADPAVFVSVVIPVYNGKRTIERCLEAVLAQDYPPDCWEVVVVDNNSTDGTPEIVSKYPVRLVYERQIQGPHAATNTGVRAAQGDVLVFTDSDCIPDQGWLRAMVAPFADRQVVAVGGRIEAYQPKTLIERFLQKESPFVNCLRLSDDFPASIITGNAAFRADDFRRVGMFNANMYTGAEVDLSYRIQLQTGKRAVYVEQAVVYHMYTPTLKRFHRHYRIYGYSEIMLSTLYKDIPRYPLPPGAELGVMLKQVRALFIYSGSMLLRSVRRLLGKANNEDIAWPGLWFVAESGSLIGKAQALWDTRFFRRRFWEDGVKVI